MLETILTYAGYVLVVIVSLCLIERIMLAIIDNNLRKR